MVKFLAILLLFTLILTSAGESQIIANESQERLLDIANKLGRFVDRQDKIVVNALSISKFYQERDFTDKAKKYDEVAVAAYSAKTTADEIKNLLINNLDNFGTHRAVARTKLEELKNAARRLSAKIRETEREPLVKASRQPGLQPGQTITPEREEPQKATEEEFANVTKEEREQAGNFSGNATEELTNITDTTTPAIIEGVPTGTLDKATIAVTLSVRTNKISTCRYSTTAGVSYYLMANTFSTTDSVLHSSFVSGLTSGQTYNYYVRCRDTAGNVNSADYTITFSVGTTICPTNHVVYKDVYANKDYCINKQEEIPSGCATLLNSGPLASKINIYFYEDGFNQKPQDYDFYIRHFIAASFGGGFGDESYLGIEPFKSLKGEFNIFSYKNATNTDDGSCWPPTSECSRSQIINKLAQNCQGFSSPSDFGAADGNYNIIVVPFAESGLGSSSQSQTRLNSTAVRLTSADTVYHNIIALPVTSLLHEFAHKIAFFDEEYAYYDLYLGARTYWPNVDSFSCTKWCGGVNTQSVCYAKYIQWLECFKTRFVDASPEIRAVLTANNLGYNTSGSYAWWGTCFDGKRLGICGGNVSHIVSSRIQPSTYGLSSQPDQQWISNWEYCKNLNTDLAGPNGCDLGANCGENGCFVAASFSKFLPSRENEFFMGHQYRPTNKFNKHDEDVLRYNILNKVRYVDVENLESTGG